MSTTFRVRRPLPDWVFFAAPVFLVLALAVVEVVYAVTIERVPHPHIGDLVTALCIALVPMVALLVAGAWAIRARRQRLLRSAPSGTLCVVTARQIEPPTSEAETFGPGFGLVAISKDGMAYFATPNPSRAADATVAWTAIRDITFTPKLTNRATLSATLTSGREMRWELRGGLTALFRALLSLSQQ